MHNTFNVRSLLINLQMQEGLTAPFFISGYLLPGHINKANVLGFQKAFGMHRGRAKNFIFAEPIANISIVGRGKPLVVYPLTYLAYLLLAFKCIFHQSKFSRCK